MRMPSQRPHFLLFGTSPAGLSCVLLDVSLGMQSERDTSLCSWPGCLTVEMMAFVASLDFILEK